jgi:hypothetical protein
MEFQLTADGTQNQPLKEAAAKTERQRRFEDLPEAAQRALKEAEARRREGDRMAKTALPREFNGRGGEEPVRYGDWEVKGLAVDF